MRGRIWDVAVDLRRDSPTYGQWEGYELDDEQHRQLFVPVGFAHGFCVLSEVADVTYKLSSYYDPATEAGIAWDDPEVGVEWPLADASRCSRSATHRSAPRRGRRVAASESGRGSRRTLVLAGGCLIRLPPRYEAGYRDRPPVGALAADHRPRACAAGSPGRR